MAINKVCYIASGEGFTSIMIDYMALYFNPERLTQPNHHQPVYDMRQCLQ
jgi:hypothetical protein